MLAAERSRGSFAANSPAGGSGKIGEEAADWPQPGRADLNNYFNYFTEIEEYFARKRGKNLLVSPLDWCLIELWRDSGVPLNIALRGIDRSFEAAEKRGRSAPRSLFYCHPAVLEAHDEHQQAMLGKGDEDDAREALRDKQSADELSREKIASDIKRILNILRSRSGEDLPVFSETTPDSSDQDASSPGPGSPSEGCEEGQAYGRAQRRLEALMKEVESASFVSYEEVDRELNEIGASLADDLLGEMAADDLRRLRTEITRETRRYKTKLDKDSFQKLQKSYLQRRLLEEKGLPPFSLLL
ncbi:MAG TPA: hypothetical protein VLV83_11420 [Acidobacteriota bacterium]|nr:hypothetical protein [Acidobacteriota bacterium]